MKIEIKICKSTGAGGIIYIQLTIEIDIPKLKEFKDSRSAQNVDNFLFIVE